ncbi:MAG: type II toxin-antitoxin system VapC family toxin [Candidatus Stahlbacteria bacterium]|nr:type II toxin-antitoxin system VapC family toxin [Candidatus Stahlbacteria bacterium]
MNIAEEISRIKTIFIDTAPIIYYIEAHPLFGPIIKEVVDVFQGGRLSAFSSVVTLTEVLPKPIQAGKGELAKRFTEFLTRGRNLAFIEISANIAEKAGQLRGKYSLKSLDAIQLAAAIDMGIDAFLTNDNGLKQIREIKILILNDYLTK